MFWPELAAIMTSAILYKSEPFESNALIRKATYEDKSSVIDILCKTFKDDPQINWMLERSKQVRKLSLLMDYIFEKTISIGDIYLTEDCKGVALWKTNKSERFSLEYALRNIKLFLDLGTTSIIRILRNESFTYQQYPKKDKFYHLYLIGVLPECQGKGYASRLMNPMLDYMDKNSIPVYLETANINNVKIYEKKGFKAYNSWIKSGLELFYMKKEPTQKLR